MPPVAKPQLHLAKIYFPAIGCNWKEEVHEYWPLRVDRTSCAMRRFLAIFSALLIASVSIVVVIENRSFTTLSWALLLLIPMALAIGVGSHGRKREVSKILEGTSSDVGLGGNLENEIDPDDLPVL